MVDVAPLTFDEYKKYADIIIPNIKESFWLCTPCGRNDKNYVRGVNSNGGAGSYIYWISGGLAPAFITRLT